LPTRHPPVTGVPSPLENHGSRRWWPAGRERRSERPRGRPPERRTVDRRRDRPAEPRRCVAPPSRPTGGLLRPEALGERDAAGHVLVTRNGDARGRLVPTVARAGALRVSDRRVEERTGETRKFSSRIVPPTLVGPRKERGPPPPLLAWVVHRGGGPGARGLRRLVGRALLGDHPAAEVRQDATGRSRP